MIDTNKTFSWQLHTILVMVLLILNLVDYHTTDLILTIEGNYEANPLMNYVIIASGMMWPILAIKLGIIGVMWWAFEIAVEVSAYLYAILAVAIATYTGVVARSVHYCLENGLL